VSQHPGKVIVVILAVFGLAFAYSPAHAQTNISTIAGGGTVRNPTAAQSVCIPIAIAGMYQGNLYVESCNRIYSITPQGQWTLIAGTGIRGYSGDGGPAVNAQISPGRGTLVAGAFVDASGNVFIADTGNNRIREVVATTQTIQTVAGNGTAGFSGDGAIATTAELNQPEDVSVDASGNIFIADSVNWRIREVVAATGNIQTVAGMGVGNPTNGHLPWGDGGAATGALVVNPTGVFLDAMNDIFITQDCGIIGLGPFVVPPASTIASVAACRIREVASSTGVIQTVAGPGSSTTNVESGQAVNAILLNPVRSFVDGSGNIFFATGTSRILEVPASSGTIQVVAGGAGTGDSGDGGPATGASLSLPDSVYLDGSGNLFIADQNGIREVSAGTGIIQTLYGNTAFGYSGDTQAATNSQLYFPAATSIDKSGNIFIADAGNNVIREIVAATGAIQTVVGNGMTGMAGGTNGDGGPALSAQLNHPKGVFVDGSENIFIADTLDNLIREVVAATGKIQTVAGSGLGCVTPSAAVSAGATSPQACLRSPQGVFVDSAGNIFIADLGDNQVREVVAASGLLLPVVGGGLAISLADGVAANSAQVQPSTVFVDNVGNIFLTDNLSNRVREVSATTGLIQTVAGGGMSGLGDGGPATSATVNFPNGVFVNAAGNVFIADTNNNVIREVNSSTGIISTVAGNGMEGFAGDGGLAANAELNAPTGVAFDGSGNLIVVDSSNARIRKIGPFNPTLALSTNSVSFPSQAVNTTSATISVTLTNSGDGNLNIASTPSVTGTNNGDFTVTSGTTCNASAIISPRGSCVIDLTFTPAASGTRGPATLSITDNAVASPQQINLTGTGTAAPAPVASLSPSSLSFATQSVGTTSSTQNITLSNSGNATLTISSITITGANSGDFQKGTVTCGATLAAGTNCAIPVSFAPSATGSRSATLSIGDNAAGSPHTLALSGTGIDFSVAVPSGGSTSATITAGQTATYNLQLAPSGFSGPVTLACTGAPSASTCSVSPTSLTLTGNTAAAFTVTVATTARGIGWPTRIPGHRLVWIPLLALMLTAAVFLGTMSVPSRLIICELRSLIFVASLLAVLIGMAACGGGGGYGSQSASSGTPAGNSMLTVTAQSGSVSRSIVLSLTVN
jgi:sugar lactone lactonase YvrE